MARAGPFKNRFSEKNCLTLESLLSSLCSIGGSGLQSVVPLVSSFHSYYSSKLSPKYKTLCRSVMFQRCNYNTTKLTQSHTKQPSYWRQAWCYTMCTNCVTFIWKQNKTKRHSPIEHNGEQEVSPCTCSQLTLTKLLRMVSNEGQIFICHQL